MGLLEQHQRKVESRIAKSFGIEGDAIEKGGKRTGYYANTSENKAKHRVGQSYKKDKKEESSVNSIDAVKRGDTVERSDGHQFVVTEAYTTEGGAFITLKGKGGNDVYKRKSGTTIKTIKQGKLTKQNEARAGKQLDKMQDRFKSYKESKDKAPKGMKEPYGKGGASKTSGTPEAGKHIAAKKVEDVVAKMRKDQGMKAFADKVQGWATVSEKKLNDLLPDYISGGAISALFKDAAKKPKSLGDSLAKIGLKAKPKMHGKHKNLKLGNSNPNMERPIPREGQKG